MVWLIIENRTVPVKLLFARLNMSHKDTPWAKWRRWLRHYAVIEHFCCFYFQVKKERMEFPRFHT